MTFCCRNILDYWTPCVSHIGVRKPGSLLHPPLLDLCLKTLPYLQRRLLLKSQCEHGFSRSWVLRFPGCPPERKGVEVWRTGTGLWAISEVVLSARWQIFSSQWGSDFMLLKSLHFDSIMYHFTYVNGAFEIEASFSPKLSFKNIICFSTKKKILF